MVAKKLLMVIFLTVGLFGVFLVNRFLSRNLEVPYKENIPKEVNLYNNAFLDPQKNSDKGVKASGKVVAINTIAEDPKYKFQLLDGEGNVQYYLLSQGALLDFVINQDRVILNGEIKENSDDGIKVLFVKSVSFENDSI